MEDDPTCLLIGSKFAREFLCEVEAAVDGLEAVTKIKDATQQGERYDLILMDIIMPNLDGVSASRIIRQFDTTTLVAMTSCIRASDIQLYLENGMNDVLPKPFTRKSLLECLEKHLGHLIASPPALSYAPA